MKTAMMIAPHADDAAAFCGATLAKLSAQGWHVILVRVTDDQKDSIGYSVEEAFWVACFDKHYPEYFTEGLEPFSVCERWYFARQLPEINHYEDVTETMDKKIMALCAHREMMKNTINQTRLQLKTYGKRMAMLDEAMDGDMSQLLGMVM